VGGQLCAVLYAVASQQHASMSRPGSNMTSTMNAVGDKAAVKSSDADTGFCSCCCCCNVNTVITCDLLITEQPSYLSELFQLRRPSQSLRSSNHNLLNSEHVNSPRPRTAFVQRSFAHAAPRVWNSLPHTIVDDLNISAPVFKSRLKTFLYRRSY